VQCPEGCGRKFNRKALEKHAKACKLVFMSKRKEFNSEAKRLVSKEQVTFIRYRPPSPSSRKWGRKRRWEPPEGRDLRRQAKTGKLLLRTSELPSKP